MRRRETRLARCTSVKTDTDKEKQTDERQDELENERNTRRTQRERRGISDKEIICRDRRGAYWPIIGRKIGRSSDNS